MVTFSKTEIKDLTIAIIVITLIFSLVFSRSMNNGLSGIIMLIPIALVTVGLSFILHELGHKVVAQKYGFFAEFRRSDRGLILAFITALLGFVFLAPGAVMIGSPTGYITEEENGKISIAGPLVNIALALVFAGLLITIQPLITNANATAMIYLYFTAIIGFNVNSYLALFNLLPIPPLDGSKIIGWNFVIWIITIAASGLLTYISYTNMLLL